MRRALALLAAAGLAALALAGSASAERAGSQARGYQAGLLDGGGFQSCAVLDDGAATCWGYDLGGELGDDAPRANQEAPVPVALPAGRSAVAIAAASGHGCVILDDGSVACWGTDSNGELGDDATLADQPTPVLAALPTGRTATAISTGPGHSCAILDDGSVSCWGSDGNGRLGDDPTLASRPTPVPVALPAGRTATAISAGGDFTCAILDDGTARCWGRDNRGQLGDDPTLASKPTPVPVALPAGRTAVAISAGLSHACALLDDGSVWCWGADDSGQVGDDAPTTDRPTPVPVVLPVGRTAAAIAAGGEHACAILDDASLTCWGDDAFGELGDDAPSADQPTPVAVALPPGRHAVAVTGSYDTTCAALDDGRVTCWGYDSSGELGNGPGVADQAVAATAPPALSLGSLPARVADVRVELLDLPGSLTLGAATSATVRITNRGPDPASGLRVGLTASLLAVTSPTGALGPLAAGAATTIAVPLTAIAAGTGSLTAQLLAAAQPDPDSTPGNGRPGEDDQATATTTIAAPPAPPALPPAPPAPGKATPEKLTLTLAPGRDASAPHATRATGRLVAPDTPTTTACQGVVTVTVAAGTRTVLTRSAPLRRKDGACEYAVGLSLTAKQRGTARSVKVTAGFGGNAALLPASARARTLRLT